MSVVINTNYAATLAANNLASSSSSLQRSLNRLASGSKIINPQDDSAGLAVSMKLSATARRQNATSANLGNAVSFLQTQDGALSVAGKILTRVGELKTLYADPTKNSDDLANYQAEFSQLQTQLSALADEKFNGQALFTDTQLQVAATADPNGSTIAIGGANLSGSTSLAQTNDWSASGGSVTASGSGLVLSASTIMNSTANFTGPFEINLRVDLGAGGNYIGADFGGAPLFPYTGTGEHDLKITLDSSGTANLFVDGSTTAANTYTGISLSSGALTVGGNSSAVTIKSFSISTNNAGGISGVTGASDLGALTLSSVTDAIQSVATLRASNGAQQSRLQFADEIVRVNKANIEAANSRITDVDVAEESTSLARYNILVQSGTAMLTQANQSAQMALRLLG